MISIQNLEKRRDMLSTTLQASENTLNEIKERAKIIKKEVSNIRGAILELDRLIDGVENF
jgi:prefoldin subunit 5